MSNFTKGPWLRDGRFIYARGNEIPLRSGSVFPNVFSCSISGGHNCTEEEATATAALIAAAPELYEALQEMTKLAEGPTGGVSVSQKKTILEKARAALAKAAS